MPRKLDYNPGTIYLVQIKESPIFKIGRTREKISIKIKYFKIAFKKYAKLEKAITEKTSIFERIKLKIIYTSFMEDMIHEQILHNKYASYCIVGEWFKLTEIQVSEIIEYLKVNSIDCKSLQKEYPRS